MEPKGRQKYRKRAQIKQKSTKTGLDKVQNFTRVQSTRAKVFAVKSQQKMAVVSPKARSTENKKSG